MNMLNGASGKAAAVSGGDMLRSQVLERHRTESRHNVLARDLGIAVMGSWRYTGLNIGQPAFEKRSERFFGGLNVTAGFKLVDESHST